jgi:hypothetical protein
MKAGVRLGMFCAALMLPAHAFGQERASARGASHARAWDVAGSIEVRPDPRKILPFALHLELGRYWTSRLKTDVRVVTARERAVELDTTTLPDARTTAVRGAVGPFGVSSAATYELFDHASTRPYASIGLDVVQFAQSRAIYSAWHQSLSTDGQHTSVLVRPFLAAGLKSYVGHSRAFMRSETIVAVGAHAARNTVLRIGAGIDF